MGAGRGAGDGGGAGGGAGTPGIERQVLIPLLPPPSSLALIAPAGSHYLPNMSSSSA